MSSPVIPNQILGMFDFLNDVFTTKPQKENFWMQFFGITASDKTTINGLRSSLMTGKTRVPSIDSYLNQTGVFQN